MLHSLVLLALAQPVNQTIESAAPPSAVTVYTDRASVTRTVANALEPGYYDLVFTGLPRSIVPASLQARVDGPAHVLSLDYEERAGDLATSGPIALLDERIGEVVRARRDAAKDRELLAAQEAFVDAVSIRATTDASDRGGTESLDLDAVRRQLDFLVAERSRLLEESRALAEREESLHRDLERLTAERESLAGDSAVRAAVVSIAVSSAAEVSVDLVYLVDDASWRPVYNVRAAEDGEHVRIEYDATLTQRTGEEWSNVRLALSTAQPAVAANPPSLEPWLLDLVAPDETADEEAPDEEPSVAHDDGTPIPVVGLGASGPAELHTEDGFLEAIDALAGGAGPAVTYVLPRLVTVRSSTQMQQRTRIATLDAGATFVHVAIPLLTEAVYVRGELTNSSTFQLLPGPASIFVGRNYVGPTRIPAVTPFDGFALYFGIDPAVTATRTMDERTVSSTGLLGGGRRTTYAFSLEVANDAGKPLNVELWDRRPASAREEIAIDVTGLSHPLDDDPAYLENERPLGLLKWRLTVPPGADTGAPFIVRYGLRVTHSKDIEITPLPE